MRIEERRPVGLRRICETRIVKGKKRGRPRQTYDKIVAGISVKCRVDRYEEAEVRWKLNLRQ